MNKKNAVAVVVFLAVVLCIGLIYYSGQRSLHYIGPSKLLAGPNGVLHVLSHGKVHQFDKSGTRTGVLDLREFDRELTPSDLAIYRDGRFLLGEASEPAVYRCDPRTRSCERFNLSIATFGHIPGNSLKFFLDEAAGRIYFSDNAGHRVLITDLDGRQLSRNERAVTRFWFPNQLWREAASELVVVNTNYHKLSAIDIVGDQVGKENWAMSTYSGALGRPGRIWPFAALHADDRSWWILNARDGMKDADLVQFSKEHTPVKRIDLGVESDPFGIVQWNDRVLVADATQYRVQTVSRDGVASEDFGDAAFRRELEDARVTPDIWRKVRVGAQFAVVAIPLIGILLLWRLGEPLNTSAPLPIRIPSHVIPRTIPRGEILWVAGVATAHKRQLRIAMAVGIGSLVLFSLPFYLVAPLGSMPARLQFKLGMIGLVAMIILGNAIWTIAKRTGGEGFPRLGCDGERVYFEPNSRQRFSAALADVMVDDRTILLGKARVILKHPLFGDMYPANEVEETILTRLSAGSFVARWKLELATIRNAGLLGWILLALVLVSMIPLLVR